jgi:hypothetical protein
VRGFDNITADEKKSFLTTIYRWSEISQGCDVPGAYSQIITLVTCRENSDKDYFVVHGVLVK